MSKIPATIFEALDASCTKEHIEVLLRSHKDAGIENIRITGPTKDDVIRNVRDALDRGYIQEKAVLDLIRSHEEAGNQHIFLYAPNGTAERTQLADGAAIGNVLLGKRLHDGTLPNFQTIPNGYVWADFRSSPGGPWTAKIYGHVVRTKFVREEIRSSSVIRYYDRREKRVVCLARWNGRELELRVSSAGSGGALQSDRKTPAIDRRLDTMWSFLAAAGIKPLVTPVQLSKASIRVLKDTLDEAAAGISRKDSQLLCHPCTVQFRDSQFGSAQFDSSEEEENLTRSEERTQAIHVYIDGGHAQCRRLVLMWNANFAKGLWGEHPLRTVVGGRHLNEIAISSSVNEQTVAYVVDQLRTLGK